MSIYHKHHIVPKHMGGTDDPSNIIELTVEKHAEAHRKLFEQYGHWQDEVAWKGLSKMITKTDAIRFAQSKPNIGNKRWLGKKHSQETKNKIAKKLAISQAGNLNSQFGTMWIHNLTNKSNKKIKKCDPIPDGWIKGRKMFRIKDSNLELLVQSQTICHLSNPE